jgi:molybdopterin synthase catalytic subunit
MIELTHRPLSIERAYRALDDPKSGGVVVFVGRVRPDRSGGRTVQALDYEADVPMARRLLEALEREAKRDYRARRVVLWHRLGRVPVGAPSVIAGAAASHRAEAFEAARFLIDALKARVPIWKAATARPGRRRPAPRARPAGR